MAGRPFFRRLDIQVAVLILLLACALSTYAFARLREDELSAGALIPSLPRGARQYALHHNGTCIGTLRTSMQFATDEYQFTIDGSARVRLLNQSITASVSGTASFNSLGQMGGSFFTIRSDSLFVRFGTLDMNPIRIQVRGRYEDHDFNYQTVAPGPVLLKENRDSTMRVEYLHLGKLAAHYSPIFAHPAVHALLVIPVEASTDELERCSRGDSALDAGALVALSGAWAAR